MALTATVCSGDLIQSRAVILKAQVGDATQLVDNGSSNFDQGFFQYERNEALPIEMERSLILTAKEKL